MVLACCADVLHGVHHVLHVRMMVCKDIIMYSPRNTWSRGYPHGGCIRCSYSWCACCRCMRACSSTSAQQQHHVNTPEIPGIPGIWDLEITPFGPSGPSHHGRCHISCLGGDSSNARISSLAYWQTGIFRCCNGYTCGDVHSVRGHEIGLKRGSWGTPVGPFWTCKMAYLGGICTLAKTRNML